MEFHPQEQGEQMGKHHRTKHFKVLLGFKQQLGGVTGSAGSHQLEICSGPQEGSTLAQQKPGKAQGCSQRDSITIYATNGWALSPLLTLLHQTLNPKRSSSQKPGDQAWPYPVSASLPQAGDGRLLLQKN